MSESKAIALVFAAMMLSAAVVLAALALLAVGNEWIALATLVLVGVGADTLSRVAMRYDSPRRRGD